MKIKNLLFHLLIFSTTLAFGIALARIYFTVNIGFIEQGTGSFGMCGGEGLGGFTDFKSYDGEDVAFFHARYETSEKARKCFESITKDLEIIESEPLYDREGKTIVGQRVVVLDPHPGEVSIFSVDGDQIYEVASTSLRHAKIFERRARKY